MISRTAKFIIIATVIIFAIGLVAAGVADGRMTERQATQQSAAYVQPISDKLNAYTVRLRTDRFATKVRFAYYLRWRDEQGRLCKFEREPQVVVNLRTGVRRAYNFDSARCQ